MENIELKYLSLYRTCNGVTSAFRVVYDSMKVASRVRHIYHAAIDINIILKIFNPLGSDSDAKHFYIRL